MNFYIWIVLQIILESFPISSSGHCLLFERLSSTGLLCGTMKSHLTFVLHIPTIMVLCVYFYRAWVVPFKQMKRCRRLILKIAFYTAVADLITLLFYVVKERYSMPTLPLTVGFIMTSLSLYSLRWCASRAYKTWHLYGAIILGCVQAIAFIPGVSRFGLTYVTARWLSITPRRSFQISFLIELPLIILASAYSICSYGKLYYELLSPHIILVMLVASIIAYIGLIGVGLLVAMDLMWLWSIYMIIPILISMWGGR